MSRYIPVSEVAKLHIAPGASDLRKFGLAGPLDAVGDN
jgi:hypothetical protein